MLTILILATVIQILAKSRDTPFILVDPTKSLKRHISDPKRRAILVAMVNEAKEKYRKYQKRMKAYAHVLNVLTSDPTTSKEEFDAIFEAMLAGIYHDQEARILGRIKGLDFINEKEFYAIIEESISRRKKMHIQNEKKWIKVDDAFNKSLAKLSSVITSVVIEKDRLDLTLVILEKYKIAMHGMISQMATWNYQDNQILADYHSTEDELIQTIKSLNVKRRQIFDLFVEMYLQLGKSLNKKEWSVVQKTMKLVL